MKKIEITTSHNVEIEYELAPINDRFLAYVLDMVFMGIVIGVLMAFASGILGAQSKYVSYVVSIPIFLFYNLLFEIFNNGQSLGKKIIKLKVVKIDGEKSGVIDYFLRWCFRILDIYMSFGALAVIGISSSSKNQRIGDLLADTTVIKVDPDKRQKLQYILNLENIKHYKVKYPEILNFSEEDMLVLKDSVDRYQKYKTDEYDDIIKTLVVKIKEELNIVPLSNNIDFLKTLIKDYVILTR